MGETTREDLTKRESREIAEQTRPGHVYTPAVDIFEDEDYITVLADLPGVSARNLTVDLREGVLSLTGRAEPPEGDKESEVIREYEAGTFFRQFSLTDAIDQAKIDARLVDGVLKLRLPKAETHKPRQITVKSA